MALSQTTNSQPTAETVNGPANQKTSKVEPIQTLTQVVVEELTPLQRQRLDAAVMLLVNYLVSASSAK